jgi:hypothetical protein
MAVAVVAMFAMGRGSLLVPVALGMGILCDAEGLAMSAVMPVWRKDVKTLGAAWRLRGDVAACQLRRWRERRRVIFTAFLVMVVGVELVTPAFAMEPGQATYTGGTLHVAKGSVGTLDTAALDKALVFRYGGSAGGHVEIEYRNIRNFEYTSPVAHHLGLLPFIARGLVRPKQRKHFFSIRYKDSSDVAQVAVFEVPKDDPRVLLEVLRARAPQVCTVQKGRCGVGDERF